MSLLKTVKDLFEFTASQPADPDTRSASDAPVAVKPTQAGPPPAAELRNKIMRFIIEKLRVYQNEPENTPTGLRLFVLCAGSEEEELYRVALWTNKPGRFREELSRQLVDNYINLPANWQFESVLLVDELPNSTYREGNLGLTVLDKSKPDGPARLARITSLVGQTEESDYVLDPTLKTAFYIGRGHTTQTNSGRVRTNDIVVLNDDTPGFDPRKGAGNGAVSRSHATIRYDAAQSRYVLLVDPGGLPASGNKTKIMHPDDTIERADIAGMGYPLRDGDQIELGGEVTLLFSLY